MFLSVLMPSNRDLAASRRSIETALRYCEKQDALLIVSDNSRDPEKRHLLERASPRLRYIVPEKDGPQANLLNVYAAAETEFILMIGDDDELFVSPKDVPFDLKTLAPDYLGIRPMIAVANSAGKVIRVKDFGVMDETSGGRVMTYNDNAKGDNAAYYSIFRRKPFVDLHRFFFAHHPLKGGYCDWALATTLFSWGKMPYDPGTIFKYNYHRWDRREKIDAQLEDLYEAVGLPRDSFRHSLLLFYLDLMVLARWSGSPLDQAGKRNLADQAGRPILGGFCRKVAADPSIYSDETLELCRRIGGEPDAEAQFELALELADQVLPGLTARYRAFHQLSLAA